MSLFKSVWIFLYIHTSVPLTAVLTFHGEMHPEPIAADHQKANNGGDKEKQSFSKVTKQRALKTSVVCLFICAFIFML